MLKNPLGCAIAILAICTSSACASRSFPLISPNHVVSSCEEVPELGRDLVVANYNIKSGMWTTLNEVGDVIDDLDADVIALEEVDNQTARSGDVDQSAVLAERMGGERIFAAAMERDGGTYGVALLSRVPILSAARLPLPEAGNFEPRVAIDATVCAGKDPLRVITAHSDVLPWAATAHAHAIAKHIDGEKDVLVLGDLNATPNDDGIQSIVQGGFGDALAALGNAITFPGNGTRIDYIMTDRDVDGPEIIDSDASDHRPVRASLAPL